MVTETQELLVHEIDETLAACCGEVTKAQRDRFFPSDAEIALRHQLNSAWDYRLTGAYAAAHNFISMLPAGADKSSADYLAKIFQRHLSGPAITKEISPARPLRNGFDKGKSMVHSQAKKSMTFYPKKKSVAKNFFGMLFGMTEDHAIEAMTEQMMLSAGGFYDDTMSELVKAEMQQWFDGTLSRDELIGKLRDLVNTRLASDGKQSLPGSYFEGLAEHFIVRSRNFGSIKQAEDLGVTHYKIQGILDHRTSEICRPLIEGDKTFELKAARTQMNGILRERDLGKLKQNYPFLTEGNALDAKHPIPPLHWRCRSWMEFVF